MAVPRLQAPGLGRGLGLLCWARLLCWVGLLCWAGLLSGEGLGGAGALGPCTHDAKSKTHTPAGAQ